MTVARKTNILTVARQTNILTVARKTNILILNIHLQPSLSMPTHLEGKRDRHGIWHSY